MRKLIFNALSLIICCGSLNAEVIKTTEIDQTVQDASEETLVLFNIAEVLMDTKVSLGTQAWRKYLRSRVDAPLHDQLTLYVFQQVPAKTPEPITAKVIDKLQNQGVPVLAFTSRGRHEWYSSQIADIDVITEKLLQEVGVDFSRTQLPADLASLDSMFSDYYHAGIIYATNAYEKGQILTDLLQLTNYRPSKIIFIDDKADSLKTVEEAANKLGIPFTGYAYSRTAKEHAHFDPMIAHIQLDWLMSYGQVLSDQEAEKIKNEQFLGVDPENYFLQLIEKWKVQREKK